MVFNHLPTISSSYKFWRIALYSLLTHPSSGLCAQSALLFYQYYMIKSTLRCFHHMSSLLFLIISRISHLTIISSLCCSCKALEALLGLGAILHAGLPSHHGGSEINRYDPLVGPSLLISWCNHPKICQTNRTLS